MDIQYTGKHFQIDDQVKAFADGKLTKLTRFLDEPIEIHLTLEVEKHRHIAELHAIHRHGTLRATEEAEQMFDSIHAVVEKMEKQARRARKKHQDKRRRAQRVNSDDRFWPVDVLDRTSVSTPEGPKIIKSGRLPIKPMTLDEAAIGLADSKNEFFVFRDSATDKVSVLYRRNDGNYGLIAPEF